MRFYATAICAICAYVSSSVFQENIFLINFRRKQRGGGSFFPPQRRHTEDMLQERKEKPHNLTWISWILLKPSFQKNSNKLEMVPGPGISARVFGNFFLVASVDVISLSGRGSSLAIPTVPLVADLCKRRKTKSICLLRRSPWKFLQQVVVNLFKTDISRWLRVKIQLVTGCSGKFESARSQSPEGRAPLSKRWYNRLDWGCGPLK